MISGILLFKSRPRFKLETCLDFDLDHINFNILKKIDHDWPLVNMFERSHRTDNLFDPTIRPT